MISRAFLASPLLLLVLLAGCSSANEPLILHPLRSGKEFSQKFNQTYAALNEDGSIEFLLIDNGARRDARNAEGPLKPVKQAPLCQLVHVKIHWLPMRGNPGGPGPANATVTWYIFSQLPDQKSDLLLYSGTGFALAHIGGNKATLQLKSVTLTPQIVHGLSDPLGQFRVTGSLSAPLDPQQLQSILTATRSRLGLPAQ